jgi:uncharacterized membrane protein YhhN
MTVLLWILIPLNLVAIALYMEARIQGDLRKVIVYQPGAVILSWLIAASSLLQQDVNAAFTAVVLAGMGIAIIGDFLNLDMSNPKVVMRGLVIAVIAYLTYGIGVTAIDGFHGADWITGVLLLAFYVFFMRAVWPGLGDMRLPGLFYGLVLPFTFWRALATFFGVELSFLQSLFLSLGTLSLYVGDIEFAVHNYMRPVRVMYGPILYSGGQFLIALSTLF